MKKQDELFDYQRKVLDTKQKTLICNWSKHIGKTYTLAMLVLKNKPKNVIYISRSKFKDIVRKIGEIFRTTELQHMIDEIKINKNCIQLTYNSGEVVNVFSLDYIQLADCSNIDYDYILFDGLLPFNIGQNAKQVVSMITVNNYNKHLQHLYDLDTEIFEVDYKTGVDCGLVCNVSMHQFKINDLNRFCSEYAILDNPALLARISELEDKLSNINIELRGLNKELNI